MGFGKRRNLTAIMAVLALTVSVFAATGVSASSHCDDTGLVNDDGDELTAHYINQLPDEPLEVTCDIGIYFDEDGSVNNVDINGTVTGAKPEQFGIYVSGTNVDVTNSSITVDNDYSGQFVSVTYQDGATGTVRKNSMSGAHRVGVLIRGEDTEVDLLGNIVAGTGAKTSGWAENGIQIDQGATADIIGNTVEGHWWDNDEFNSSGLLIFADETRVHHNVFRDNDLGVSIAGDNSNFVHNVVEVTKDDLNVDSTFGVFIWPGDNNGVRQSQITSAANAGYGLWIYQATNTKLIRNHVSGWGENILDNGTETKLPRPFAP